MHSKRCQCAARGSTGADIHRRPQSKLRGQTLDQPMPNLGAPREIIGRLSAPRLYLRTPSKQQMADISLRFEVTLVSRQLSAGLSECKEPANAGFIEAQNSDSMFA